MQGNLICCYYFSYRFLNRSLSHRFSALYFQQISNAHKQTIYEKLNIPTKPKKPMTAFLKFLSEVRPTIIKEYPRIKATDLVKVAAQKWNCVDSKLKDKLTKEYSNEAVVYHKLIDEYNLSLTPEQKDEIKKAQILSSDIKETKKIKKKSKELGRPKQPPSTFIKYLMTRSNEKTKYSTNKDWIKAVSEEWKTLSPNVKLKLQEEWKDEFQKWNIELKIWEEKMLKEGNVDVVRSSSLPEEKKKIKR